MFQFDITSAIHTSIRSIFLKILDKILQNYSNI